MAKEILILILLSQVISCENTTGQYRHDKKHHQKVSHLEEVFYNQIVDIDLVLSCRI